MGTTKSIKITIEKEGGKTVTIEFKNYTGIVIIIVAIIMLLIIFQNEIVTLSKLITGA